MSPLFVLDIAKFVPLCVLMAYAALSDWKTKEVPNKLWLYVILGITLTIMDTVFFLNTHQIITQISSIIFALVFALTTFYIGGWGGADAKALITIGLSIPLFPSWSPLRNLPPPFSMFPFIVIFSGSILAVAYALLSKSDAPIKKRKIKFIPFMFIALIICVII
jgi:preflagellin peptidase FlaK